MLDLLWNAETSNLSQSRALEGIQDYMPPTVIQTNVNNSKRENAVHNNVMGTPIRHNDPYLESLTTTGP